MSGEEFSERMMAESGLSTWVGRLAFAASQGSRVAWYAGHGAVMRRMTKRIAERENLPKPSIRRPDGPVPDMRAMLRDVAALMARDLANVEAGHYPPPADEDAPLAEMIATSRAFFRDVPAVLRRQRLGLAHDVVESNQDDGRASATGRPDYYMQNFHFQTGGWMTDESARIYDMQVEVLFSGAANAMRRQALVPIAEELRGRDQRRVAYADIATGTGVFLPQLRRAFPRLPVFAVDLSEPYLRQTARRMGRAPKIAPVVAKAEALPFGDASLDLATCVYLFHELPPEVRRAVAAEMARAVKPGGLLVVVDSLQRGDDPGYDGLLTLFPQLFHEPYFETYLGDRLEDVFEAAGFVPEGTTNAFLSKVVRLRRRG
jgi:ubiquinone/menaquinone biosynthesis C-methylase UbiE